MAQPIILIDVSDVNEGALDDLKRAMAELAQFVKTSGTRAIARRPRSATTLGFASIRRTAIGRSSCT